MSVDLVVCVIEFRFLSVIRFRHFYFGEFYSFVLFRVFGSQDQRIYRAQNDLAPKTWIFHMISILNMEWLNSTDWMHRHLPAFPKGSQPSTKSYNQYEEHNGSRWFGKCIQTWVRLAAGSSMFSFVRNTCGSGSENLVLERYTETAISKRGIKEMLLYTFPICSSG